MKKIKQKTIFCLLVSLFILHNQLLFAATPGIGDTINVPRIIKVPVIDGTGNDLCWDSAAWNPMPYVWIPYGQTIGTSDFYGRFKAVWNEPSNLMYFLFEITDDKFVNGYVFSESDGNYYLYDVVEIFIDEDRSGGNHETNNNAFAYHITGGNSTVEYDAVDMWSNVRKNYKDHLPEFKRVQNGNVYTWEFSLMVMTDAYNPASIPADYKSTLQTGKKMGFTAAYCDNDNSAINPQRDNFIASKYLTQANSNESYKNADHFGLMQLVNEPASNPATSFNPFLNETETINIYPNPVSEFADVSFSNNYRGEVKINIFNLTGQLIHEIISFKYQTQYRQRINVSPLKAGMYLLRINTGPDYKIIKIIKRVSG